MKIFLRMKHWQLFLLIMLVPLFLPLIVLLAIALSGDSLMVLAAIPIIVLVCVGVFFSWFYALGTGLHEKLPEESDLKIGRFKFSIFLPVTYMLLISLYITSMFFNGEQALEENFPSIFAVIVPLHLLSMFCIFYSIYFISKALKSVELQRNVTFNDYAGEFFLLLFYFIGIWILQPRINKIFYPEEQDLYNNVLDRRL